MKIAFNDENLDTRSHCNAKTDKNFTEFYVHHLYVPKM